MTADTHWKGAVMAYITCEDLALGYEGKAFALSVKTVLEKVR